MAGITVLRVETSAQTTSFRYPRVQIGKLPTFEMPPPATIYGHLAGVIGEWFEPADLEFAYSFQHAGKATDLELIYPIERGSGKPGLKKRGWPYPINVECSTNIQRREFLLHPKLTLYLKSSDQALLSRLQQSFLSPHFAYLLGRSQDLATCHDSRIVPLESSDQAYFADTLLPFEWRPWITPGMTVLLPSSIDYRKRRFAVQQRYLQVTRPPLHIFANTADVTDRACLPQTFLIDAEHTRELQDRTLPRGLYFWPVQGPSAAE